MTVLRYTRVFRNPVGMIFNTVTSQTVRQITDAFHSITLTRSFDRDDIGCNAQHAPAEGRGGQSVFPALRAQHRAELSKMAAAFAGPELGQLVKKKKCLCACLGLLFKQELNFSAHTVAFGQ